MMLGETILLLDGMVVEWNKFVLLIVGFAVGDRLFFDEAGAETP